MSSSLEVRGRREEPELGGKWGLRAGRAHRAGGNTELWEELGGSARITPSPSTSGLVSLIASEVRCTSPQVQMDQASTLLRVQRPQEVSAAQKIFLLGCSESVPGEVSGGHSGALCSSHLPRSTEVFQYLHTWFGHPRVCWLQVSSAPERFGRGRCLGGAGMGGASYEKENQRGFWQFTWPPLYLRMNSKFMGQRPPAESLPTKPAMPLQVVTAAFKGPDARSRASGRWFL